MKTILSLLLLLGFSVFAQTNNTDRVFFLYSVVPAPTNLPSQAYYVTDTNAVPTNNWQSLYSTQWDIYLQTNQAGWQSWFTNSANPLYQEKTNRSANVQALMLAYSNLNFVAQNWASITNLPTAKFAIQAEGDVLLKLKPVLIQFYQGQ